MFVHSPLCYQLLDDTLMLILVAATLVYPSKMLYPVVLPLASMLEALYASGLGPRSKMKLFYIAFFAYAALSFLLT